MASWYNVGLSLGEPGSAVIVGHADSEKLGPAAFNLGKLQPGDLIKVQRKDRSVAQFKVDWAKSVPKPESPPTPSTQMPAAHAEAHHLRWRLRQENKNCLSTIVTFATHTHR